eukprot:CAMPEP_0202727610 /NCGR_PEP_ID=MMETSP1385-20130828/185210_1 /ASSEMBLY_ACC=CAM_ASM_000861 /TAXON_ID=933848 /ORGANISM="Elphidium margaritaceum" /LENGTH=676 /DNA_ID=CAMNT_0049393853 /DNA_START=128 /DNA_END=2158 /DNA_ORIENTATION=-
MMVDDILQLAHNQQFLERITNGSSTGGNLELLKKLPKYTELTELERSLHEQDLLNFNTIFHEPVGIYLIQTFLVTEHSVDKAIFVSDVELFKTLNDPSARQNVADKIFTKFCAPETYEHVQGISVFAKDEDQTPWYAGKKSIAYYNDEFTKSQAVDPHAVATTTATTAGDPAHDQLGGGGVGGVGGGGGDGMAEEIAAPPSYGAASEESTRQQPLSLLTEGTNTIGVYGKPIGRIKQRIDAHDTDDAHLFDEVLQEVLDDLRLDAFPRFETSIYFKTYIQCKAMESKQITIKDFLTLRPLGRGAFGLVQACEKRDCGKLYAIKQINKKRVQATESLKTVMQERDYLAMMNSKFVTTLKYAIVDDETIYIILDLMLGGDLKYHLNVSEKFSEARTRFHAAQVLLGLEHIHTKGIVYRDLKLENVLVDEAGHCKISDLGLAVLLGDSGKVRGYAGTPGYTAPEVVLGFQYNHIADFFSLGVMIYRCLCGKKPFLRKSRKRGDKKKNHHRKSSALDRNVIEMEPEFPPHYFSPKARSILKGLMAKHPPTRLGYLSINHIKQHPWFDDVDFGLLEAGYLKPPFDPPKLDQVHSPIHSAEGAPPQDKQYANIKITAEFEEALKDFEFLSKQTMQEELVEVLKRADAEKFKDLPANNHDPNHMRDSYNLPNRSNKCFGCELM